MAHMFPSRLDPNTSSSAEKRLFPVFRDYMSDDFTVFHGPALQITRKSGGIDDREIDFLVAHPGYGLQLRSKPRQSKLTDKRTNRGKFNIIGNLTQVVLPHALLDKCD